MRTFYKKLFTLLPVCLLLFIRLNAQQSHFIYLQTENKQPFYVKLDKKNPQFIRIRVCHYSQTAGW
ncbi:hypothetical protein [Ferruginibacter sp.]